MSYQRFAAMASGLLIMSLAACVPAPSGNTGGGTAPKPSNNSSNGSGTTTSAALSEIGTATMSVLQNGSARTLAQVAAANSTPFTLFQFAGVTCESCKTESPHITQVMAKFPGKISRYIIFPNQASEYQPSEYQGFTSTYASSNPYLIDDSLSVIKKVRANTTQYFGVYILVAKDGRGTVLNAENAYLQVESTLKSVVGP
jgi:hypothetical protein